MVMFYKRLFAVIFVVVCCYQISILTSCNKRKVSFYYQEVTGFTTLNRFLEQTYLTNTEFTISYKIDQSLNDKQLYSLFGWLNSIYELALNETKNVTEEEVYLKRFEPLSLKGSKFPSIQTKADLLQILKNNTYSNKTLVYKVYESVFSDNINVKKLPIFHFKIAKQQNRVVLTVYDIFVNMLKTKW